jgi:diguanylate cyclase (GGDEF)-like protein
MLFSLGVIVTLIETNLATYVAARAWNYRPARMFVLLVGALVLLHAATLIRLEAADSRTAYVGFAGMALSQCALNIILLVLLSALFVPQWWEGARPIRWIIVPYLLAFVVLGVDLLGRLGLFASDIPILRVDGFYHFALTRAGMVIYVIFDLSWLPHLCILGITFIRLRRLRLLIGCMALAIVAGLAINTAGQFGGSISRAYGLIQTLPMLAIIAYAVIRKRLFEPTRAALDLALRAMSEAVAVLAPSGTVLYVNPEAAQLGLRLHQPFAVALRAAAAADADIAYLVAQQAALPSGAAAHKLTLGVPPRRFEISLAPVVDAEGRTQGTLLLGRDITELEHRAEQLDYERARLAEVVRKLSHQASHDALTGLPNRRSLEEHLERAIARARRGRSGALLFLDLDNFKLVNDTLGHAAGDELLTTLTQLLAAHLRADDLLARLGGDEFAIILDGVDIDGALGIAERMRAAVEAFRFTRDRRSFELGLSIGVVAIDGQQTAQALLAQADIAMYSAKEQGRNRVARYQPSDAGLAQLAAANQWVTRIKDALHEDHLTLHFQPIVRLSDRQVVHYEVLLRMRAPNGELISPSAFIPAAERFGLMPQIDRWVVAQALQLLQSHMAITLFVNISRRTLMDEAMVAEIANELRTRAIAPERLGFELNETAAVHDLVRTERWVRQIRELGCRVAMDDFGVGFTSFAYLRSLPVDQIKIAGAFMHDLTENSGNRAIVQAIHTLTVAMGKIMVAEYIEDAASMTVLQSIGITYGQGYHLGRPEPNLP